MIERAYVATEEPLESDYKTPEEKDLTGHKVQTLDSKEKIPVAGSTRKDAKESRSKDGRDKETEFLESEARLRVPKREIETPRRKLSFGEISDED